MLTATRIRVLRIITRLNIGGPAHHVATLANLAPDTFETRVIHGLVGDDEADASDTLVHALGDRTVVPQLGRRLSALKDCAALFLLARELFRFSPRILHTHTAKAGALGRLAGFIHNVVRPWRRIRTVHTFHGHVFDGYFGRWRSMAVRWIERGLSRITDRIIVISERQQFDIVERFDIAPASKTRLVPIGLDLKQYLEATPIRKVSGTSLGSRSTRSWLESSVALHRSRITSFFSALPTTFFGKATGPVSLWSSAMVDSWRRFARSPRRSILRRLCGFLAGEQTWR